MTVQQLLNLGLGQAGGSDLVLVIPSELTPKVHARTVTVQQLLYLGLGQAEGSDLVLGLVD